MPHGTPDFWGVNPRTTTHAVGDVGELAVRLGCGDIYDRRGNVIYITSFENGLSGWLTGSGGGNSDVYYVVHPTKTGHGAVLFSLDAVSNAWANIYRSMQYPVLGGVGMEFSFAFSAYLEDIFVKVDQYSESSGCHWGARYYHPDGKVQIYGSGGGWIDVATIGQLSSELTVFHTMKIVADTLMAKYVRLMIDDHCYDISNEDILTTNWPVPSYVKIQITAHNQGDNPVEVRIDDVIFTQNEG